jgi:hypothetical protein
MADVDRLFAHESFPDALRFPDKQIGVVVNAERLTVSPTTGLCELTEAVRTRVRQEAAEESALRDRLTGKGA